MSYYENGYKASAAAAGVTDESSVRALQEKLNSAGAGLDVDGIYGPKTDAAYRKYIAGTGSTEAVSAAGKMAAYQKGYSPSAETQAAYAAYESVLGEKPAEWVNPYEEELSELYDRITSRRAFSYNPSEDSLYRQYREEYLRGGKRAMEDTMGKAASLTGGYGSTYAQTAGQETYDRYVSALNSQIPALYEAAYDRYVDAGTALAEQYGTVADASEAAYDRYRDSLQDWQEAVASAAKLYSQQRDYDYETWSDALDYWTDRADAERETTQTTYSGSTGSTGKSAKTGSTESNTGNGNESDWDRVKKNENALKATPESQWGRYARAISRTFSQNENGRFDLAQSRADYLDYYRKEGLITQGEYYALLQKAY